jgi:cold shock CspA family protein
MGYKLRTFHGTVVRFFAAKGYGYVRLDAPSSRQAHFHLRDFGGVGADQIRAGNRLEFYLAEDPRGLRAVNVTLKQ